MNIQIFGTKKDFETKKAERYFKERGIRYQFIDMKEKGLSKGEFLSVLQAVGGYEKLIDPAVKTGTSWLWSPILPKRTGQTKYLKTRGS